MISLGLSGRNLTVKTLPGPDFKSSKEKIMSIGGRIPVYKNGEFQWWEFDKEKLPKIIELWGEKGILFSEPAKKYLETLKIKSLPLENFPRMTEIKVHPKGKTYKDYQEFVVGLAEEKQGLLIFFDCGLGKTLASLGRAFNTGAEKLLIIAPKNALIEFKKELRDSFGKDCLIYRGTPAQRKKLRDQFSNHSILLTNYQMLKELLDHTEDIKFEHVIFDECHNMADLSTIAYKQAKRVRKRAGEGFRPLLLSATPFENDISDLWTFLNFVSPEIAGSREDFLNKFREPIAFKEITKYRKDGSEFTLEIPIRWKTKNLVRLKKLLDTVMIVVESDKYKSFEDAMEIVPVEMTSKQARFYDNVVSAFLAESETSEFWSGNPLHKTLVVSKAAEGLYLFQDTPMTLDNMESGKIEWVMDDIKRRLTIPGSKSIYWSAFRKGIDFLEQQYYGQCVAFTGDKSDNYKKAAKYAISGCDSEFEFDEYDDLRKKVPYFKDIEPGSIQLAFGTYTLNSGAGLNLQAVEYQCIMSYDNKSRSVKQVRDRIRRLSTQHAFVTTKYLVSDESDEEAILLLIFRKLKEQSDVLVGRGGAESIRAQDIIRTIKERRKQRVA